VFILIILCFIIKTKLILISLLMGEHLAKERKEKIFSQNILLS